MKSCKEINKKRTPAGVAGGNVNLLSLFNLTNLS